MPTLDFLDTINIGKAEEFLTQLDDASIDLYVTSPPYADLKKASSITKEYVSVKLADYNDWFVKVAREILRTLKPTGSFALNIDTMTVAGCRDLYINKLLIRLVEEVGFTYIQDAYYIKPGTLPTGNLGAYNRMKPAVEPIWWLAKTKTPKANSRNVLMKYSEAFEHQVKDVSRRHLKGVRSMPSGHKVDVERFCQDRGGSIPVNYIFGMMDDSNTDYMKEWKRRGLPVHPARFPELLPKWWILFLTDEGDVVVDPFSGSGTTSAVAKKLNRRYIGCELSPVFVEASQIRLSMLGIDRRLEDFVL